MQLKNAILIILMAAVSTSWLAAQQHPTQVIPPLVAGNPVYSKLPLTFEANYGQTAPQVDFLSRGKGYTAFLTSGGMVLSLRPEPVKGEGPQLPSQAEGVTLQFRLLGASRNPPAAGESQQPGVVNYFIGNDPAQWHRNVPTYARVRYTNVYPGIDLIYYGSHQQLEYDFAIAPGVDPALIQFEILGSSKIQVDTEGNLILATATGDLRFLAPAVYQESMGQRIPVKGNYEIKDATHVGFQVAAYDPTQPLVIDPVLVYSSYLGGSGIDQPTGIAVDNSGDVYVAGYTSSANFPLATIGILAPNANHVFVAKLDHIGSNLIYADYIGGNSQDYGSALALDGAGEVLVTGSTQSSNFPAVKAYQSQQPGPYSGFLAKVSADGSSLLYSTYLGGSTLDQPTSVAVDTLNEAYVAGYTMSQNFPILNPYQANASPNQDGLYGSYGFLTKFSSDGSSLVYSTYFSGYSNVVQDCGSPCWPSPYNVISAISVDATDNAYVTGSTNTYNFPTTPGTYQTSNTTQQDLSVGFISKFASAGSLTYSTYFYSSGGYPVTPNAIAVDNAGSAYITGVAYSDGTFPITSTSICDPGAYGYGCSYGFVTKFDSAAATLLYSTFLGPNNYASPLAIAIDSDNDAYVVAATRSTAFGIVNGLELYTNGTDALVVEIDPAATTEIFATFIGGSGDDIPSGIALDSSKNIYLTGSTSSVDYPITQGAFQTATGGSVDGFITKIGTAAAPSVSASPSSLQFGILTVGSPSQAQTILLRNMGSSPLSINSITVNGDFSETNDCSNSIAASAQCTFSVIFTPTATGPRSGSVVISDDASGSPHQITLNGTGAGPNALLAPLSLAFSTVVVGASSPAQAVTLTNNGTATLIISSIQIAGDYSETNNCPTMLSDGGSCTINVQFTPTANGTRTGSLIVTDNAIPNVQTVPLNGTGSNISVTLTPSNLTFLSVAVGTASVAESVTLTNIGGVAINLAGIQVTGDFSQTNNCPATLAFASVCTINVQFKPTTSGARVGTVSISDSAPGSPQTVGLSGTGTDFSITSSPSQNTVKAGSSATYVLSISPIGGIFANSISLICSGLPANAACKFLPAAVIPGGSVTSSTLTISTVATSAEALPVIPSRRRLALAMWMHLQILGLFGIVVTCSAKRSERLSSLLLLALVIVGMTFMTGCAGGTGISSQSSSPNPGSTYTVTVQGYSGNLQHSLPLTLTVQ